MRDWLRWPGSCSAENTNFRSGFCWPGSFMSASKAYTIIAPSTSTALSSSEP